MNGLTNICKQASIHPMSNLMPMITPKFPSSFSREIVGDYVKKYMLAHHFSHYYSWRSRWMVFELAGVINPSVALLHVLC